MTSADLIPALPPHQTAGIERSPTSAKPNEIRAQRGRVRKTFKVMEREQTRLITLVGRTAWALGALVRAGAAGCTPLTTPGPRWSDYVFKLRRLGFDVETIDEQHGGPYAGTHARYVLRQPVEFADESEVT